MHELSVAQNILEIVHQYLPENEGQAVKSITLRIGEFAGIIPESLEFCFTTLTQGTVLAGASLRIDKIPLRAKCETCGATSSIEVSSLKCPLCQSSSIKVVSGRELEVVEIEVDDVEETQ